MFNKDSPENTRIQFSAEDRQTFEAARVGLFVTALSLLDSEFDVHRAVRRTQNAWLHAERHKNQDGQNWLSASCLQQSMEILLSRERIRARQTAFKSADELVLIMPRNHGRHWLGRLSKFIMNQSILSAIIEGFSVCGMGMHPSPVDFEAEAHSHPSTKQIYRNNRKAPTADLCELANRTIPINATQLSKKA